MLAFAKTPRCLLWGLAIYIEILIFAPQILWYIQRVVFSSIGNPPLYGSKIRGYFVLLTVILWLLKSVRGLRIFGAVLKGRANANANANEFLGRARRRRVQPKNSPPADSIYTTQQHAAAAYLRPALCHIIVRRVLAGLKTAALQAET